jgi:hypothetical protein
MNLYRPLSITGKTPDYEGVLPVPTYELCGDFGVYVAVGSRISSLVYRGVYNKQTQQGIWNWVYIKEGDSGLQDAPVVL